MAGSGVPAGWRLEDEPQARESARESSARRTGNTVPEGWKLAPVNEQILVAPKPEPEGWLDRTLRSGKATLTTAKRGWDGLAGGLARGTAVAADTIGFDSLADIARRDAAELEAMAATPVVGARSWADVKRDPLGNIIPFVTEQGLGGVPDMAMAVASLPVYAGLRASSMGQDRAVNNGRADATLLDVLKAAPAAVGSAALERFGTRGILGDVAGEGLQAVGRAGVREGITEGLQSPLEYAGTNVGTNAGFDPMVAAELAAQGIVVGAPFGAAANAGVQMVTPGAVTDPEPDLIDGSLDGAVDPLTAARQEFDAFQAESAPLRGQNPVVDMALNNKAAELEANMRRAFAETRAAPQPQTNSPAISDDVSIIAAPEGAVRSDDAGGIAGLLRQRVADSDVLDRARERAADNPTLAAILDSSANTQQQVKTLWDRLGEIDRAGERGPFPDIDMSDVNIPRDAAGQVRSLPDAAPARARVNAAPSNDGVGVIKELFPNARVTSGYRGPDHPLSKKNPNSYHAKSRGAVDMAPIEGITFEQAKARIQDAGYPIIEGINEVGKGRTKNATGEHWHFVVGERNGNAPAVTDRAPTPLRVADEDELRRRRDDPPMFDDKNAGYRGFENTDAPESATNRQRIEGNEYTSPTQTGDSSKAFPETPDDPAGNPRYWEDRANMTR